MKRRRMSVKLKITLWFTAFMTLIAGLCLGLIVVISTRVSSSQVMDVLERTVREDAGKVRLEQGTLNFDPEFRFYENGVYIVLYNAKEAMLTGQTPPGFPQQEPLENGVIRSVSGRGDRFYVFDLWIPSGWEDGVWLRGVIRGADPSQTLDQSFAVFLILLPFIILSAALGGYMIARKALAPMEKIIQAAESISEGKDLGRRIGLNKGDEEVVRLSNSFDQMFQRLEKAFEGEKQFASDASHELRTPTAVILAQCAYMDKYAEEIQDYKEGVEVISRQAQRMSTLISRLLDMTRLDFGTSKPQMEETDISALVEVLCQEQDTKGRGISIETEIQPGIQAQADPHLFSRAVVNLLDNARKYGKENGYIRVRLKREQGQILLQIEDNGIGIGPEDQERIWQRFYQVSPSRESGGGLGLGLSMVRQIIELHGGEIQVESVLGQGSTFTIRLPEKNP